MEGSTADPRAVQPASPGTRGIPGRGLLDLLRDPLGSLSGLARDKGDLAFTRIGLQRAVLVSHPDGIREMFGPRASSFTKGRSLHGLRVLLGDGLITSQGKEHARQRRLVQPMFSARHRSDWIAGIVGAAARATAQWSDGDVRDVEWDMLRLSLLAASEVLFSAEPAGDLEDLVRAMRTMDELSYLTAMPGLALAVHSPIPSMVRFRRARGMLQQAVDELIRRRLADGSPPNDFLSALLTAHGTERDLAAIRDEVTTLWVAAYVTTGHALAWALDCLARTPSAQHALAREADEVLDGRVPTTADVARLTWSRSVFAESLRLYPPAWILGRHAGGNAWIGDTHIPRETLALASPWVTHRDARWYPAPLAFDPGRWLLGHPTTRPFAYIPFGAGLRRCVGEPLAWLEGTLVLAILASRWSFHPVGDAEPTFRRGISLASRHGLPVRIYRRIRHRRTAGAA